MKLKTIHIESCPCFFNSSRSSEEVLLASDLTFWLVFRSISPYSPGWALWRWWIMVDVPDLGQRTVVPHKLQLVRSFSTEVK